MFEEAGLCGTAEDTALGHYTYKKRLHYFSYVTCKVDVFPTEIGLQMLDWPEKEQRQLIWTDLEDAANKVREPGLADLLRSFEPQSDQPQ